MAQPSGRDPRRSLIIGSVIAAVILAAAVVIVLVGVYIAFAPRSNDLDSGGRPPTVAAFAPIHLVAHPDS